MVRVIRDQRVVYHRISPLSPVLSLYTHEPFYFLLYHAIENTVADTIKATYTYHTMGRFSEIPSCSDWLIGSFSSMLLLPSGMDGIFEFQLMIAKLIVCYLHFSS